MEIEMSNIWVFCYVENVSISGIFYYCLGQNADMVTIVFLRGWKFCREKIFENVGIFDFLFPNENDGLLCVA